MSVAASSNAILKIVAIVAGLVATVVVLRACHDEPSREPTAGRLPLTSVSPDTLGAEGDTEVETLRTLIGEVRRLRDDTARLRAENEELRDRNVALERMEDRLNERLASNLSASEESLSRQSDRVERQSQDTETLLENLERRLSELTRPDSEAALVPGSDLPIGLGFDAYLIPESPIVWIPPLDAPTPGANGRSGFPEPIGNLLGKIGGEPLGETRPSDEPTPVYAVPRNATLIGARGMTALIGRIPVSGQVVDPFSFKVLVGADNLAANGFLMPELFGMVFSGRAVGDWALSCVRGEIVSVTFILEDGSIQSYPPGETDLEASSRPIGWISDPYGVPCLSGERKTNAPGYLAQRVGLSTAASAAEAAAAAQTATTVSGATGTTTSAVTGDMAAFVRSRAIADGIDEVARWLDERQSQSFDAIYVPPDSELVIHLSRELHIDQDPHGRKVNHRDAFSFRSSTALD